MTDQGDNLLVDLSDHVPLNTVTTAREAIWTRCYKIKNAESSGDLGIAEGQADHEGRPLPEDISLCMHARLGRLRYRTQKPC